jgi:hypothetical protein
MTPFDEQIASASLRAERRRTHEPFAVTARYDSELGNGTGVSFAPEHIATRWLTNMRKPTLCS